MKKIHIFCFLFTSFIFWGQNPVDFKSVEALLTVNPTEKSISGNITYIFEVKNSTDTIFMDAKAMNFSNMQINAKNIDYRSTNKHLKLYEGFKIGKNKLTFSYKAQPKQTLYFVETNENNVPNLEIWTQGQGKYTSHWLPSFDDVNEKVIFNISVTFDKNYTVISNGKLKKVIENKATNTWVYQMQKPMSSYLVMLAIGKFYKQESTSGKTPLEFYLAENSPEKFRFTYKHSEQMFQFLEREIGINYPWKIYRQIPVKDFIYAGMENTTSTLFSTDYVVDSIGFNDKNYCNVNAHELAHQWFGNLITAQNSQHHWLHEGFATYYALLAEQEVFGENYFAFEMLQMAEQLKKASKNDTIPLLNPKASSLTFYKKGAWVLHLIKQQIGAKNFNKAVKNYLKKYQYKTVNTQYFFTEIKKLTSFNEQYFYDKWLNKAGFDLEEAKNSLKNQEQIKQYFEVQNLESKSFEEIKNIYLSILKSDSYHTSKEEIIYQIATIPYGHKKELIEAAMQTNNIKVRQAVAQTFTKIPLEFKDSYETFLNDASYSTQEIALIHLWKNFPSEREKYLEISKNWIGFTDKNLRVLWLTLAYKTENYQTETKENFLNELISYASPTYESSIRLNAFDALKTIPFYNETIKNYLQQASKHHRWQFAKYAKEYLKKN